MLILLFLFRFLKDSSISERDTESYTEVKIQSNIDPSGICPLCTNLMYHMLSLYDIGAAQYDMQK